jgi:coenzyme F420-reducing hydrogenase beta subunit
VTDEAVRVLLWDGTERTIPLTDVEPFTRHGCCSCSDYLGETADIAVGALGALPGYATLIIRTPAGEAIAQNACSFGLLETIAQVDEVALNAAKGEKDRRTRAQAFDEFCILMMDALSDPKQRVQVREQFVKLYGAPKTQGSKKEERHAACGGC